MLFIAVMAALISIPALAAFVWITAHAAVEQITDNLRHQAKTRAFWSDADPDAPVPVVLTDHPTFDELDAGLRRKGY